MNDCYVYEHLLPSGAVFYVGKGIGRRAYSESKRSKKWKNKVAAHGGFGVRIKADGLSETEAFALERQLIAEYGKHNLCNLTDGGEGSSGLQHSAATKAKLSAAMQGRPSPTAGKPASEETRIKIAEALRGKPKSAEAKAAMAAAKKGSTIPQEVRSKIAASLRKRAAERRETANVGSVRTKTNWSDVEALGLGGGASEE